MREFAYFMEMYLVTENNFVMLFSLPFCGFQGIYLGL